MVLKESYVACGPGVVASAVNSSSNASTVKGNSGPFVFVSDDILTEIMDFSLKRIPKKSAAITSEFLELWSDELHGKTGFVQYRSILVCFISCLNITQTISTALQPSSSLFATCCVLST